MFLVIVVIPLPDCFVHNQKIIKQNRLEKAAQQKDNEAQHELAIRYWEGSSASGVDYKKSIYWFVFFSLS